MIGVIHGINDKIVTLEATEGVKIKVLKNQIAGLLKTILEADKK